MEPPSAKIQDDLMAYHGRPAVFYPAVKAADDITTSAFPAKLASGLGTAKFLCGACLALLGGMAVYVQAWSAWTYGGIWSGLFAIFTGLCVILASRRLKPQRKSLLMSLLVLSVLGFFNTGLLATFTAMGLVAEVYAEDVGGTLVWRGVSNASPFVVQLMLLAIATADCLLSLACCVITGREVCCCGSPTPAVLTNQRRDRLITWLGSQQPQKVLSIPQVRLVPSVRQPSRQRSKTPSTLRVFPPANDVSESLPSSSSGGTSTNLEVPLVKADHLSKKSRRRRASSSRERSSSDGGRSRHDGPSTSSSRSSDEVVEVRPKPPAQPLDEKYFALDRKLSEEFIDRTWNF